MSPRRRILVLCFDPLTDAMPGPAIRAWHLAEQLATHHEVVLAGTAGVTRTHPVMAVRDVSGAHLAELTTWADAVFAPTSVVARHPEVTASGRPLCIDMYIPTHLENLEALHSPGSTQHVAAVAHQVAVINRDLCAGDFFLCASERQRDFWLGSLATSGRLNPATYGSDPTLRNLVAEVPFGMDPQPVEEDPGILRRTFPAIGPDDPVVIWGGGVYNWFDPLSVVRAVDRLRNRRPALRLVFLGMRNPNPGIPEMRVAAELRAESDRRQLTGTHVFFNEGWVAYERRGAYLADADVAVSTHLDHVETHFSFRTRVLDYLWAGLPMVLTGGDTLSEEIDRAGLGVAVAPGDPDAIAAALDLLLDRPPEQTAIRAFGARYGWPAVARPLLRWADDPRPAADRNPDRVDATGSAAPVPTEPIAPVPGEHQPAPGEHQPAPAALAPLGVELRQLVGRRLPPRARAALRTVRGLARRLQGSIRLSR